MAMVNNIFGIIEEWQQKYYRFGQTREFIPSYSFAYKHMASNYLNQ
jgi:hypothetical protein